MSSLVLYITTDILALPVIFKNFIKGCAQWWPVLIAIFFLSKNIAKSLKCTPSILKEIIDAEPTDGLWDDGRTDEGQLGLKYSELEEAMSNLNSINRQKYEKIRKSNLHKMEPIPVCKIPN